MYILIKTDEPEKLNIDFDKKKHTAFMRKHLKQPN